MCFISDIFIENDQDNNINKDTKLAALPSLLQLKYPEDVSSDTTLVLSEHIITSISFVNEHFIVFILI